MSGQGPSPSPPTGVRYELFDEIARGGMARVHLGRSQGDAGFARTVAIKRLHRSHGDDPELVAMLLDEARLVTRVRHPNVVPIVDVVEQDGELLLAMEYVHGETLTRLSRACPGGRVPPAVAAAALVGALRGLHAAHEAYDEQGEPLELVHRDVSPQNIMVGTDGVARVLDFGIAKASQRSQVTRQGHIKGKYAYMAPEQIRRGVVDRRTDVFAAAAVLYEMLTGQAVFGGDNPAAVMTAVMGKPVEAPGRLVEGLPPALDALVLKGLAREPGERFASAREMALALERAIPCASAVEVGAWVEAVAAKALAERSRLIARAELATSQGAPRRPASPGPARPEAPRPPTLESFALTPSPRDPSSSPFSQTPSVTVSALSLPATTPARPFTAPPLAFTAAPRRGGRWRPATLVPLAAGALAIFALAAWGAPQGANGRASKAAPNALGTAKAADAQAAPNALATAKAADAPALPSAPAPKAEAPPSAVPAPVASPALSPPKPARPAPAPAARPAPARAAQAPAKRATAPEQGADSCSPPYSIEDGIRIPKAHCL